ncbi:glycosyltransferase family 2 protein [Mycolicibacterium sp. OfavD-34-C]|uniref:glycosyltransferase family 2 protein n=1 Tax=Mycolicibacterium sp. OfavD-34-C TaxID=2917746 RepID=UPI0035AB6F5F
MRLPKLVVTMPAYNASGTIKQAVTSTLRAMPSDSHLLVLDDKSADDTLAVLATLNDRRLRVIEGQENVGGGKARIRLLDESDSELVASMDADDICFPWRFVAQLRMLEDVDAVFSSAVRFGSRIRPSSLFSLHPVEFPAALLYHCPVWQPSFASRRSAVERVGGYRSLRFAQDYDLWLRMASSGASMSRMAMPVFAYREGPAQVTKTRGYLDSVKRERRLNESYTELFNSRVNDVSLDPTCQSVGELTAAIHIGLTGQLQHFRYMNRKHYARILSSGRTRVPLPV